jgi:hypothetical protein
VLQKQQERQKHMEEQKAALKRKQRKVEKEAVAQGKKPYYPKKCMMGGLLRWGCLGATLILVFVLGFELPWRIGMV